MARTAVVLFNLGGPSSLAAVKPFLFNLFNDPAIIRLPSPLRWLVARLIVARRASTAQAIYERMGGRSPIVEQTEAQADALRGALRDDGVQVFIAMRYWHPMTAAAVEKVLNFKAEKVVLLPLYPQFSTTTTESSFRLWDEEARRQGLKASTVRICCYPDEAGFVGAIAAGVERAMVEDGDNVRVLFSAHGLPRKFVEAGDPYQLAVERSVSAVVEQLNRPDLDYGICYQSRVGPMEWLRPYTEDEIRRAATEGKSIVVVPVAFVSEHSETLVELDIEYREVAERAGARNYRRVPTVGTEPAFIDGLAALVRRAAREDTGRVVAPCGGPACPSASLICPYWKTLDRVAG